MLRSLKKRCIEALNNTTYQLIHFKEFDYSILEYIPYVCRSGRGENETYNDCIIMADTETSKRNPDKVDENYVVAWTISIRAANRNIVTLWGQRPDDMASCFDKLVKTMKGQNTVIYWHNMAYDWVFIRKFMFQQFGLPDKQLNVKPHYPIFIHWENGIIFKDSLILSQRSLDKWAKDMQVNHQKAVGKWDYDKIRQQTDELSQDELEYIEHDTLSGVECLQKTKDTLNKFIFSMPYTATGIPREEVRNRGKEEHAHQKFLKMVPTFEQQLILENVYHGGYTHGNRHYINLTVGSKINPVICRDFSSSYPYCLLAFKYPSEKFTPFDNCSIDYILRNAEDHAFIFKLILIKPKLKDNTMPLPTLQFSKCVNTINAVTDNGRILCAGYVEIYLNEIDLEIINKHYDYTKAFCVEVQTASKRYLPRWFTDYVYQLYSDKCKLKGGDPVLYSIAKAKLNSLYGLCVQKPYKPTMEEQYLTGDYEEKEEDPEEEYNKYVKRQGSVLPYFWGVWCTSHAFRNLIFLTECADQKTVYYCDTDSCYAQNWDEIKVNNYNENCKKLLIENGYNCVVVDGIEYWPGVAEYDKAYSEFKYQGAKRYCGRDIKDNELHITVAGVPKKGAVALNDNIDNFTIGTVFPGSITGKKTHAYFFTEGIYTDNNGNICGDSIDLYACDYLLDSIETMDWEKLFTEEIAIQVYEEE